MELRRRAVVLGGAGVGVATVGGYVAWRRVAGEDPRVSAARRFDASYDAAARALVGAPAVPEAIARGDARALESALLPLQVAHKVGLVDVLGADGKMILALRADQYRDRARNMVDADVARWPITARVLSPGAAAPPTSAPSPSPAAVVKTSWGEAVYRANPVTLNGRVVGAILIGVPLEEALKR